MCDGCHRKPTHLPEPQCPCLQKLTGPMGGEEKCSWEARRWRPQAQPPPSSLDLTVQRDPTGYTDGTGQWVRVLLIDSVSLRVAGLQGASSGSWGPCFLPCGPEDWEERESSEAQEREEPKTWEKTLWKRHMLGRVSGNELGNGRDPTRSSGWHWTGQVSPPWGTCQHSLRKSPARLESWHQVPITP